MIQEKLISKSSFNPPGWYKKLRQEHGPQHWWPLLERQKGGWSCAYRSRKRLTENQRFETAVGAILTQNTAWTNAVKALINLKHAQLLNSSALAGCPKTRLARLIRTSGYFNQKAECLLVFSRWLVKEYQGKLSVLGEIPTAQARSRLLRLHGIGPETADSILLYACTKPVFVVDAYTRKYLAVQGHGQGDYAEIQRLFMKHLPRSVALFREFHALLVAWGKQNR